MSESIKIKRNVSFELERRKDKNGQLCVDNVPIRMVITYNGNRIIMFPGYRIDMDKWNKDTERVFNGCKNKLKQTAKTINDELVKYENFANEVFILHEINGTIPEPDEVKNFINAKMGAKDNSKIVKSIFDVYNSFIECEGEKNTWAESTVIRVRNVKNHLEAFDSKLTFLKLNEEKLQSFVAYLRDNKKMQNVTISKDVKILRWFLKWASGKKIKTNEDFREFKPKFKGIDGKDKTVIYLDWDELMNLRDFKIPESKVYLQHVRDVFLFSCFTGLRHSDIYKLKRTDIRNDLIRFTTKKTTETLEVQLHKYSKEILDRYSGIPFKDGKALPVISNQKMNDYLKELGELAGINTPETVVTFNGSIRTETVYPKYELLSTHAGRRSFITNCLTLGVPLPVIMEWTGHKSVAVMAPYIKIADKLKSKEMNKFNSIKIVKPQPEKKKK